MIFVKSWEHENTFWKAFFFLVLWEALVSFWTNTDVLCFDSFAYEVTDKPSLGPAI